MFWGLSLAPAPLPSSQRIRAAHLDCKFRGLLSQPTGPIGLTKRRHGNQEKQGTTRTYEQRVSVQELSHSRLQVSSPSSRPSLRGTVKLRGPHAGIRKFKKSKREKRPRPRPRGRHGQACPEARCGGERQLKKPRGITMTSSLLHTEMTEGWTHAIRKTATLTLAAPDYQ